jgi:hypothetical protein
MINVMRKLASVERRFVILYTLVLAISFSPYKALGLVSPIIFLLGLILFVRTRILTQFFQVSIFLAGYSVISLFYFFMTPEFSFINHFFLLLTASSIFVFLCDLRAVASVLTIQSMASISTVFLFVQASWGIIQGIASGIRNRSFDIGSGDNVRGTIEPGFAVSTTGSNVMFAILVSTLVLFVFAVSGGKLTLMQKLTLCLACIAWLLASALHTIVFMIASVLISVIIYFNPVKNLYKLKRITRKQGKITLLAILFSLGLAGLLPIFLPVNTSTLPVFMGMTFNFRRENMSEKTQATLNTLQNVPKVIPAQPLVGLGPGQYSSRASLIRSGEYMQAFNGILPKYSSSLMRNNILYLWLPFSRGEKSGSTLFPFYSWLTLYSELGFFGVSIVLFIIASVIRKFRTVYVSDFPYLGFGNIVLLVYVALLGFQDNYWEFTQAIFPVLLCINVSLRLLNNERRRLHLTRIHV